MSSSPAHVEWAQNLVNELIDLWKNTYIKTNSFFGFTLVRCTLICVPCDLPALSKVCEFTSYNALPGCSKYLKEFPCIAFSKKSDYSGYDKDS